ncbi:hypothetical protein FSW04_13825 [Baekduia soli]|uniref:Uncharacterized protein n=1 Tax=Baekduia soli TaxID=496014 RepID=A0A5B8U6C0_9ACTN|nr:hypothetical protein [Baekduia soli]QEC48537.1 hypothetical protein FSW04_13825 [Baekduia soli]
MIPEAEPLPIAMRAYAPPPAPKWTPDAPSEWALIFDCETTRDTAHSLRFGAFQVRNDGMLERSGYFYDPVGLTSDELTILTIVARDEAVELLLVADFIADVFFPTLHQLGGLCIGFNLPFDISRLALRDKKAKGRFKGGFSFELSDDEEQPRVRVLHRSSTSAMIDLVPRRARRPGDSRGFFADVRTVAKAVLGESFTLRTLAERLQTQTRKASVEEHGATLTRAYIKYCAIDVQVTWECFATLATRYESYGLTETPLTSLASEASIGKGSLRQMAIEPWRTVQPRFAPELIGQILSTYSGGRSEVRLRREIAEVSYSDFLSMYSTVCILMNQFSFVIAQGVDHYDATDDVRGFLDGVELADLQSPETWLGLAAIVQIRPDADRLPVRAAFGDIGSDIEKAPAAQYGMAQSYLTSDELLWVTLADCIASKLITGQAPEVVQSIRFAPRGPQDGLQPIDILGNPKYRVDPYQDDFYKRLVDLRSEVKTAAARATSEGDAELAARLDTEQKALKLTASATSYGCFIELNATDREGEHVINAYGLDGVAFAARVKRDEQPGRYFHPLLGTLITGAARLMLVIAERLARDEGLDWAFMDTDSIALTKPPPLDREDFHHRVQRIRDWFSALNPYASPGSLLELEDINYGLRSDGKTGNDLEPLYCYAVSPKRYVMFNLDSHGQPIIRKASAHGLGHLLAPYDEREAPAHIPHHGRDWTSSASVAGSTTSGTSPSRPSSAIRRSTSMDCRALIVPR